MTSINNLQGEKSKQSIALVFLNLFSHIRPKRRFQLALLLLVMLASGIAELVSLGMVLPFLLVISEPERLWELSGVRVLSDALGFTLASQLLLPVTVTFGVAVVIASAIRILNLFISGQLAAAIGSDLSCKAYMLALYQPYKFHLQTSSSAVLSSITAQIGKTVVSINALLQLIASAIVAASLFIGLLLIDPPAAILASLIIGAAYIVLALTARRELSVNGKKLVVLTTKLIKALQEGLGAIRDILLDGSQQNYLQIYFNADRPQRQLAAKINFISNYPRFALEALGILSIALIGYFLVSEQGSSLSVIPLLGSLALGAQRLLPALQQVYRGWATLNSQKPAVINVLSMLSLPMPALRHDAEQIMFSDSISIDKVSFRYSDSQPDIIHGLSLNIKKGESIGFIGSTGSGKSTLLDLLMGLLAPSSGRIFIDGLDLYDSNYPHRLASWRSKIAHVPQSIFLADTSIAENIAFGVPKNKIYLSRVKQAAELAQIAEFIETSPDGYQTLVGERGMRLSGGQRQRIGIARALFKKANVLVFDEATSALDNDTELSVMNAISELSCEYTTLIIAHRLSTLARCDRIIVLEKGAIQKVLNSTDPDFKDLLK